MKARLIFALLSLLFIGCQSSLTDVPLVIWTERSSVFAIQDAATAYALVDPNVVISSVSGSNQQNPHAIMNGTADVVLLTGSLPLVYARTSPSLYTLPLFASAIVPIYRLDSINKATPVVLSRQTLARIYMGEITWWNDSAIQSTNLKLTMPNLPITITIDADRSDVHRIYTTAFSKFDPNFTSVIPITDDPAYHWPLARYANYNWYQGLFGVGTGVYNQDGSIGLVYQSIAIVSQNSIASMLNKASQIVRPSATSVTFAATELGTSLSLDSSDAVDLTDCAAASGWPLVSFSYLLIDTINARGTCKTRTAMVKFFLNFYQSTTMTSLLGIREVARIPEIVMKQMDIVNVLGSLIQCRGSPALQAAQSDTRIMAIPPSLKFLSNLLVSMYPSDRAEWVLDVNPDNVNIQRLVQNEVDLVFFDPYSVDSDKLAALKADESYQLLPTFAFSFAWTYNPQMDLSVRLSTQLLLDEYTVSLIYYSCILNWDDPAIIALNPWLLTELKNMSVLIQQAVACYSATNSAPAASYLVQVGDHLVADNSTSLLAQCVKNYSLWDAYYECTDLPDYGLKYVADETVTAVLVAGKFAGQGVMVATNDPIYALSSLQVTGQDGKKYITQPNPTGMAACASDTFNPTTLSFDFRATSNTSCYPWTQQIWVAFRKTYVANSTFSESCTRGMDALTYLSWLYTNQDLNSITERENFIRLSRDPIVLSAYLTTLNGVLCDGETMLITLPIEWKLSSGFAVFGMIAALMGVFMTLILAAFVIVYYKHPIIRASSPAFMLLSLFGVLLLFLGAIALITPVTNLSCSLVNWLINIGLMSTFSPLFAKVWRVYRIFGRRKLSVVKISNRYLLCIVAIILLIETLLLIIWQVLSPLQPLTNVLLEGTPQREHHYSQCGVHGIGVEMFALIGVEKGCLLVFGALMAFTTRRVTSSFNESNQVALAIYNVVFSLGLIAPIILVISAVGDVLIALLLFVLLWIAFFTSLILVVPKWLHIRNGDLSKTVDNRSMTNDASTSGFSFLSLTALLTPMMTKSYLASLRRHVEAVETHIQIQQRGNQSINQNQRKDQDELITVNQSNNHRKDLTISRTAIGRTNIRQSANSSIHH